MTFIDVLALISLLEYPGAPMGWLKKSYTGRVWSASLQSSFRSEATPGLERFKREIYCLVWLTADSRVYSISSPQDALWCWL